MSASATRTTRSDSGERIADLTPSNKRTSHVGTTRQQLEELDALLQRMLDLPVNAQEPEADQPPAPSSACETDPLAPRSRASSRPAPTRRPIGSGHLPRPSSESSPPDAGEAQRSSAPTNHSHRSLPPSYLVVDNVPNGSLKPSVDPNAHTPHEQSAEPRSEPLLKVPAQRIAPVEQVPPPMSHIDPVRQDDLTQQQARLQEEPGDWVPLRSSWQPSAQTWKPLAETWQQAQATETPSPQKQPLAPNKPTQKVEPSAPVGNGPQVVTRSFTETEPSSEPERPTPSVRPVIPPPLPTVQLYTPAEPIAVPEPPHSPLLWPLLAVNAVFDLMLLPLGPIGTWLRRPSGRSFLGAIGLLALGTAAALMIAKGIGWMR